MKVTKHPQGVPSWAELMTTDEAGALAFYSQLFGWTDDPAPIPGMEDQPGGTYHQQRLEGDLVGGIGLQNPDERAQGVPPHWTVYLAADDAEAVTAKAAAAGGNVMLPPMDVMDLGRMAVIADPTGGVFGLWEPKSHTGFGRTNEPGAPCWAELMTDDPARAADFYTAVLGVPSKPMDVPPGAPPYTLLGPADAEGAGIFDKGPEMANVPNMWGVYFEVADCDATVAKTKALGGSVLREPMDIMPGRFAVLADPQGAVFNVIKSNPVPAA